MNFSSIVNKIAYKCKGGAPNWKRHADIVMLKEALVEEKWARDAIDELISNLYEDDIIKNKKSGNIYPVKKHNPKTQDLIKKNASEDDIEKYKEKEDDEEETTESETLEDRHSGLKTFQKVKEESLKNLENADKELSEKILKDKVESVEKMADSIQKIAGSPVIPGSTAAATKNFNFISFATSAKSTIHLRVLTDSGNNAVRKAKADEVMAELKKEGYEIKETSKPTEFFVVAPDGTKSKIFVKKDPGVGKAQGESEAYEAISALSMVIAGTEDITPESMSDALTQLINEGTFTTSEGTVVNVQELKGTGKLWLQDPNNFDKALGLLKPLLDKEDVADIRAAAKSTLDSAIEQGDLPEGTKLSIVCEGGLDTDENRSDLFVYGTTPDGEKVLLVGISIKDGTNSQLGQLGAGKARDAIASTEPESEERKKALQDYKEKMISKLPEAIREKYYNKMVNMPEDKTNFAESMLEATMEVAQEAGGEKGANVLFDHLLWNFVGTNPPKEMREFLYVDKGKVVSVPIPPNKNSEKVVNKMKKALEDGRLRMAKDKRKYYKGDNPDSVAFFEYETENGEEVSILNGRDKSKILATGERQVERTYNNKTKNTIGFLQCKVK
tara:strand:+ start:10567 stop:12408 length:1842 start_codon:yes stop_codon:yes gene_type:complete